MGAAGRWFWGRGTRRDRTRRADAPAVTALESRALASVNNATVAVYPDFIKDLPGGPQVEVRVVGVVDTNSPITPTGIYFVTDEYGADEPRGTMPLVPEGLNTYKLYQYAFDFTVSLQAKRSTNTPDGRHYDLFVGGTDEGGTNGRTVRIVVPKTYEGPYESKPVTPPRSTPADRHR